MLIEVYDCYSKLSSRASQRMEKHGVKSLLCGPQSQNSHHLNCVQLLIARFWTVITRLTGVLCDHTDGSALKIPGAIHGINHVCKGLPDQDHSTQREGKIKNSLSSVYVELHCCQ